MRKTWPNEFEGTISRRLYYIRYGMPLHILMEYFSNLRCTCPVVREILQCRPEKASACPWGFSVVVDIKGASLSIFSGDVLRYLKRAGDVNSSHYPMSIQRVWVVYAPYWIAGAFGTIIAVLPVSVPVDLLSSKSQSIVKRSWWQ